jgi:hypothetical protein
MNAYSAKSIAQIPNRAEISILASFCYVLQGVTYQYQFLDQGPVVG